MPFDDAPEQGVLVIPWQQLSESALDSILEEFVTREGTDYGDASFSLSDKKLQVLQQLQSGAATLLFDPVANSCHIQLSEVVTQRGLNRG